MKLFCSNFIRVVNPNSHIFFPIVLALLFISSELHSQSTELTQHYYFSLGKDNLATVLKQFSQQSSLQILYSHDLVDGKESNGVKGEMLAADALKELLQGTGLTSRFINKNTVAIFVEPTKTEQNDSKDPTVDNHDLSVLADIEVRGDRRWWGSNENDTVFGFHKPLLETPRSVTVVSGDAIDLFNIGTVEDLSRMVPGAFTTTRFGVQGSVDMRNIPADTYFRGMKRITLQGHGRSVLASMDSIEVVGGPASPLLGIGKIGGYVNFIPKSGRSNVGQYFKHITGFSQFLFGDFDRREMSFGFGGPLELHSIDKHGGYYIYGLAEDSDSYSLGVPIKQKVFQAASSIENMVGAFRLETGINFQESRTAGALTGRFTQSLVDDGIYISGTPLVNLDLNSNGTIGYLEMQTASPVNGILSSNNQPLQQVFDWPTDSVGNPLSIQEFPRLTGIPQTMYTFLQANPHYDPTGMMVAQGVGGPIPISGSVPVGMVLDPSSVSLTEFYPRRSAAFEKGLKANFLTAYADLIYDENPDFMIKNQFFVDSMNQYKSSNQPFSQTQDVSVIENKLTIGKRFTHLPDWLEIDSRYSINFSKTISAGKTTFGDYSNHRTDAASPGWNTDTAGMTANTTFTSSNDNTDLLDDGLPWGRLYRTQYSVFGAGALFDINISATVNIVLGVRIDGSVAENIDYAGRFEYSAGTSANPGHYETEDESEQGWDSGSTWSASLSYQLPYGFHPYLTYSEASIILDRNNNSMFNSVIAAGHFGRASLKEVGVKFAGFDGALEMTTAVFQQGRIDVDATDPTSVINAYATSTTTEGWQTEVKWAPTNNFLLTAYAINQVTRYTPNIGGSIQVDARALGFADVYDPQGNVLYPAEAFLYGGRARILLPNGLNQYEKKQGNPQHQIGVVGIYQFAEHWGLTFKSNYLSSTCTGRLCLTELPESLVFDLGLYWHYRDFSVIVDGANITDEQYFRARTGDTLGDVIAQVMPGRAFQLTVNYRFGDTQ